MHVGLGLVLNHLTFLYIIVGAISSVLILSLIITIVFATAVCFKKRDKVKNQLQSVRHV